ncbi:MAG: ATP-binding cassette domain-containing protein [Treponema sp.]|nr:ATP-binding cassette domain-containing protein [Treponema sp.]
MALLEMKNVSFYDGFTEVIQDTSLIIEKGSVTAFLGESGGGKSTVLKLLSGIVHPSSGKVFYNDKSFTRMSEKENLEFRKKSAFMFQNSALWANQSLYQNLELPLKIHFPTMPPELVKSKIEDVVKLVGFNKPLTLRPAALSAGEQKRIAFARALICDPEILFLDEPTESLNEKAAELFISILKDFCSRGNTLAYVSHDYTFINTFKNDKYYFANGTIVDKILLNDNLQNGYEDYGDYNEV